MIVITTLSCISMMFETASHRVMTSATLQVSAAVLSVAAVLCVVVTVVVVVVVLVTVAS